jgi:AcrR family transcriptional regulator
MSRTDDGRVHRGIRTRGAIAAAFVALVDEGNFAPTSQEVADRAGVGHRTVFRHFQDMESLYRAIHDEIVQRAGPVLEGPPARTPLPRRIAQLVRQRTRFHARITQFRRALIARYWTSPALRTLVHRDQAMLRALTRDALPESRTLPASDFELLELLLSFEAWSRLRELQGLSERRTREVIETALRRLMLPGGGP